MHIVSSRSPSGAHCYLLSMLKCDFKTELHDKANSFFSKTNVSLRDKKTLNKRGSRFFCQRGPNSSMTGEDLYMYKLHAFVLILILFVYIVYVCKNKVKYEGRSESSRKIFVISTSFDQ